MVTRQEQEHNWCSDYERKGRQQLYIHRRVIGGVETAGENMTQEADDSRQNKGSKTKSQAPETLKAKEEVVTKWEDTDAGINL